ncbi:class I SAM-dependent methyltransferase [Nocardioides sp. T2.26MG-1]|uniref:class I SAM-dependent methyltransferase n=1 Tax=Nocardioides sp. T2.26MG-1 TaxID=3041166 RepID=UPI002540040D|nr:class I SAM-dependent methyltransferase [Nocardioides sp. T2.26MG-1]
MSDHAARHWDDVYSSKAADETSWYQQRPATSLRLLSDAVASTGGRPGSVVDVGAGTSSLVDELLAAGWAPVTVLDVSAAALATTRARLPEGAEVRYVVSDIVAWQPDGAFDAWHDRAVFHFLTEDAQQARYVAAATDAVRPGGVLVIGTFGPGGPEQCSGLPVARHDVASLRARFAPDFEVLAGEVEVHRTPWGSEQQFTWATLRRT